MATEILSVPEAIKRASRAYNEGRLDEAERFCRAVLESKADHFGALHVLAAVQSKRQKYDEALSSIEAALAVKPDDAAALYMRGMVLKHLEQPVEALASYDKSLTVRPDDADTLSSRGIVLKTLKRFDEALASYDRALVLRPNHVEALVNRGNALMALNRHGESIACYDQALQLRPGYAEAFNNRGTALCALGRYDEALTSFGMAVARKPDYAQAQFNAAQCMLLTGDLERGFRQFEWRWRDSTFASPRRNFSQKLWLGIDDLAGKTILLHGEQGFGDVIQFCRYAPLVAARGGRVVLEVFKSLYELALDFPGVSQVVKRNDPLPAFDLHCPLSSLPLAFHTRLESIPAAIPYLQAPATALKDWKTRLEPKQQPRIGLAWSGNPKHGNDRNRSISLRALLPLLDIDATFVSLQKNIRSDDAAVLKELHDVLDFGEALKDFSDTAALVTQLDLVISVDTSVAHLAGALGTPVWIMLPYVPDWRWLLGRDDCPWYPTARLFRQDQTRVWDGAIERVAAALRAFVRAKSETPDTKDTRRQAYAAYKAKELVESEKLCHAVLASEPNNFDMRHLVSVIQWNAGRPAEALVNLNLALALQPNHADALNNRGIILQKLKRFEEALLDYEHELKIVPDKIDLHFHRGTVLRELNRYDEAIESFDRAIGLKPDYPEALSGRASALKSLKRIGEALESYDRALALQPNYPEAHNNRGNILQELKRLDESLASFDRAIEQRPDYAEAYSNRGIVLKLMGRIDESIAGFDRAIAIKPDYVAAHMNRALSYLMLGDFERGWDEYEWRWKSAQLADDKRQYEQPVFTGQQNLVSKTVLLYAEQGLGDTIQFSRYAALVAKRGARVILHVQPAVKRLLSGMAGPQIEVLHRGERVPPFDLHCPLLSLPRAFGTRLAAIPPPDPRVRVPQQLIQEWSKRLGRRTKPRIGIVWSGKATFKNDHHRSSSFDALLDLLDLPVEIVSLQKEVRDDDAAILNAHQSKIAHFGPQLTDFMETAALVSLMDVVISVDTSVAHLAGTLGWPTWVLLPRTPDWRWLMDRDDSPWYPSVRLFRQKRLGDWDEVMQRVVSEISHLTDDDGKQLRLKTAQAAQR